MFVTCLIQFNAFLSQSLKLNILPDYHYKNFILNKIVLQNTITKRFRTSSGIILVLQS
ncbi:hypothetical protein pb186bvf_020374, partial [Paramecium bursaria]